MADLVFYVAAVNFVCTHVLEWCRCGCWFEWYFSVCSGEGGVCFCVSEGYEVVREVGYSGGFLMLSNSDDVGCGSL